MTVAQIWNLGWDLATPLLSSTAQVARPVLGLDPVPEPSEVTPGWLGFGFFVALFVVTILLWFNMRKQLGKINFDDGSERGARPGDASGPTPAASSADAPPDAPGDARAEPPASDRP